jgi:hypothetical protein
MSHDRTTVLAGVILLLILLGFLAPVFTVSFFLTWRRIRRRRTAWSAFAEQQGWSFTELPARFSLMPTPVELRGRVRGRPFSVHTEVRGRVNRRQEVTVARLELGPTVSASLFIQELTPRMMGRHELSDAELESVIDAESTSAEGRALLQDARVRRCMLDLSRHCRRFSIAGGHLEVERHDVPERVDALEAFITPVLELGGALAPAASERPAERARG